MNLNRYSSVFFIGIGGIGMSALAEYFISCGKQIAGYDLRPSDLTKSFEKRGAQLFYTESLDDLKSDFKNHDHCLVVYTPAVPNTNAWIHFFKSAGFELYKRSQVLGMITESTNCFAVAGTHGKTTTSSMLAHILAQTDLNFTAFLGGISNNFKSNYYSSGSNCTVVEADEYDRSFLRLSPDTACITSTDADHLDIYGSSEELKEGFEAFAELLADKNRLVVCNEIDLPYGKTYGEGEADFSIANIQSKDLQMTFDLSVEGKTYTGIKLPMLGRHNVYNAVAAFAMAYLNGVAPELIISALATFKGIARRFSVECNSKELIYVDDYAHHPTAIQAVYEALNQAYPNDEKTLVFQPHLFSRTADFMEEFARTISLFDQVFLMPIYPARELPMEGITSEVLLSKLSVSDKRIVDNKEVAKSLKKWNTSRIVVSLGAGDIGLEVEPIKSALC